jgi:hypothetical protein
MAPHQLLQSTFLDILFKNRNQQYGACDLHRHCHKRLAIATGMGLPFFIHPAVQTNKPLPYISPDIIIPDIPPVKPQKTEQPKLLSESLYKPAVPAANVPLPFIPSPDRALMTAVTESAGFSLAENPVVRLPVSDRTVLSPESINKEKKKMRLRFFIRWKCSHSFLVGKPHGEYF